MTAELISNILRAYLFDSEAIKRVERSISWTHALLVFVIVSVLLNWANIWLTTPDVPAYATLFAMVTTLIFIPIGIFITYGLYHLFMKLMNVHGEFTTTLKMGAILSLPSVIISNILITVAGVMGGFSWVVLIPLYLPAVAIGIWFFAVLVYSYSIIYSAGIGRLLVALLVLPLALLAAITLLITLVVMLITFIMIS